MMLAAGLGDYQLTDRTRLLAPGGEVSLIRIV